MAPRAYWKGYLKLSLVSASINLNLCWTVVKRDVLALGISSIFQTLTKCLEKIRGVGREQPDDRHRPLLRSRANGQATAPPSVAMKSRRRIWMAMCPSRGGHAHAMEADITIRYARSAVWQRRILMSEDGPLTLQYSP